MGGVAAAPRAYPGSEISAKIHRGFPLEDTSLEVAERGWVFSA